MTPAEWMEMGAMITPIVGGLLGVVVWAVRLEGSNKVITTRLDAMEKRQDQDEASLAATKSSIETKIADGFRDMRTSLERIYDKLDDKADKPR